MEYFADEYSAPHLRFHVTFFDKKAPKSLTYILKYEILKVKTFKVGKYS